MDIHRLDAALARTTQRMYMAAAAATVLWGFAAATPWFDPVYGAGAARSDKAPAAVAESPAIGHAAVTAATSGKAIFRTARAVEEKVIDELGHYELRGISKQGDVYKAYIRDTKRKKTLLKRPGDMLDSFEVIDVQRDGVKLRRGAEEVVLSKG